MKKPSLILLILLSIASISVAYAGGLDKATSAAIEVKTWLYGFLGIVALIYLMIKGAEAWADRAQWSDFGWALAKVSGVGAVLILGPWAWNLFA